MIVSFRMIKRAFAGLLCAAALCRSAVPTPKEHFGFTPGDDYKLADYSQIFGYFQKLAQASDRIRVVRVRQELARQADVRRVHFRRRRI